MLQFHGVRMGFVIIENVGWAVCGGLWWIGVKIHPSQVTYPKVFSRPKMTFGHSPILSYLQRRADVGL
jgi:hypothetical protein